MFADREAEAIQRAMAKYEAAHPGVLRIGGDVKAPNLTHRVHPDWEKLPKERRTHRGPIILEAVISSSGELLEPMVVSKPQPHLDAVVLEAVKQWRYEPARLKGKPVAVFMVITVTF